MAEDFPARLRKKLPQGYEDKVNSLDLSDIKEEMYKLQRNVATTQKDMKEDPKLEDAKIEVSTLEEPYKESIAISKVMIRFLCHTLDERQL